MLRFLERFALWRHDRHYRLSQWWLAKAEAFRDMRRRIVSGRV